MSVPNTQSRKWISENANRERYETVVPGATAAVKCSEACGMVKGEICALPPSQIVTLLKDTLS